jgi:hypothetical protein
MAGSDQVRNDGISAGRIRVPSAGCHPGLYAGSMSPLFFRHPAPQTWGHFDRLKVTGNFPSQFPISSFKMSSRVAQRRGISPNLPQIRNSIIQNHRSCSRQLQGARIEDEGNHLAGFRSGHRRPRTPGAQRRQAGLRFRPASVDGLIVDTPVWSYALRKQNADDQHLVSLLENLIKDQRALIIGPIRQEILSGYSDTSTTTGYTEARLWRLPRSETPQAADWPAGRLRDFWTNRENGLQPMVLSRSLSPWTAAADLSRAAFSSAVSLISITCSTPPLPSFTGTPMNRSL